MTPAEFPTSGGGGDGSSLRSVRYVDADTTITADDDILELDLSGFVPDTPGQDEYQQVIENWDVGPSPSGTYTVTINGETTPPITLGSSNEDLRTAYATLPSVELDVNLGVDGGGTHSLHFMGEWAEQDVPEITVDPSGLVDADVFVSTAQEGTPAIPGSGDSQISVTIPLEADESIPVGFECEVWVRLVGNAVGVIELGEGVSMRGSGGPASPTIEVFFGGARCLRKIETNLWAASTISVYDPGD